MYRANYSPGSWVVVAGPNLLVLLEPDLKRTAPKIERIWSDVLSSTTLDQLVASLVQWGPEAAAAAIFQVNDGQLRLTYRGQASVLDANSGAVVADGAGSPIWRTVEPTTSYIQVNLGTNVLGAQRLPLLLGVVGVSSFTMDARQGATLPRESAAVAMAQIPEPPATSANPASGDVLDRFGLSGLLGIAQPLAGWEIPSPAAPAAPPAASLWGGPPPAPAPMAPTPAELPLLPPPPPQPAGADASPGRTRVAIPVLTEAPSAPAPALVTPEEAAWMAAMEALTAKSKALSAEIADPTDRTGPMTPSSDPPLDPAAVAQGWMNRAFAPGDAPAEPVPITAPISEFPSSPAPVETAPDPVAPRVPVPDLAPVSESAPVPDLAAVPESAPVPDLAAVPESAPLPESAPPASVAPPADDPGAGYTLSDIEQATQKLIEQLVTPLITDWTVDPADAEADTAPDDTEPTDATPEGPAAIPPAAAGGTVLAFGGGLDVPVDGVVIIGRAPQTPDNQEKARLIKISSATHGLSRSHVRLEPTPTGFLVTDLQSTNGTVVEEPDGRLVVLDPDVPLAVPVGTVLKLGGAVEARIVQR